MPDIITYCFKESIIRINSIGHVPTSEWYDSLDTVKALKEEHGLNRILIDTREQLETSEFEEIAEFAQSIPKDLRIALLVEDVSSSFHKSTEAKQRFLEAVARMNGVVIRIFLEETKAIEWLKD